MPAPKESVSADMETVIKFALGVMAAALVSIPLLMYNVSMMQALGMMGEADRPLVQLKKGTVTRVGFDDLDIGDIAAMRSAYPSWFFAGSAIVRGGEYDVRQAHGQGLLVGVSDPHPDDSVWSGIFAMTPSDYSSLYHVRMAVPRVPEIADDPSNYMNVGMYVQTDTSTDRINYVACTVDIRPDRLVLRAESGLGNGTVVTSRTVHWEKSVGLDHDAVDCTLVTNGDNYFRAIVDGQTVFESDRLDLQMPKPFNAYLETQVLGIPRVVYGQFSNYYSANSPSVEVIKLRPGQQVSLWPASATAGPDGVARLDVAGLPTPYHGQLVVHASSMDAALNSTFAGGDVYSYGPVNWVEESKYFGDMRKGGTIKQ